MRIDIDSYSVNKKVIQDWYLTQGKDDPEKAISTLACATMVPCIVVAFYIGEVSGWPPEVINTIKTLIKFYKYTEIANKPPNCPI